MTRRRALLLAAGVVILLAVTAAVVLRPRLDGFVRDLIERRGSKLTQTAVRVESVTFELSSGRATVRGLTVANPPGFSAPYAIELGEIHVQLALTSLLSDPLEIEDAWVVAPHVFFELDARKQANIEVIRRNVEAAKRAARRPGAGTPGAGQGTPGSDDAATERRRAGPPRRLIVYRLALREGEVTVDTRAAGGKLSVEQLPAFELTNIGVKKGGATPAEVGTVIVVALARDVAIAVAATELEKYVGKDLGGILGKVLKKGGAGALDKGLGSVLDLLGK